MAKKPSMLKDEFTDKYYEESHLHNKDLFHPNRTIIRNCGKPWNQSFVSDHKSRSIVDSDKRNPLPNIGSMSQTSCSRNDLLANNFKTQEYHEVKAIDYEDKIEERVEKRKQSEYLPNRF